jgi:hypothetical protein
MNETDLTIVYKTYRNDLPWLKYSLASLQKFFKHPYRLLIYCHDECLPELEGILAEAQVEARVIPVEYDIHGYLKQMVVKCMCWQDVDTEYVAIMDSDVILKKDVHFESFWEEDKIKWYCLSRTPENNSEEVWAVWQDSVLRMTGKHMDKYYMYNAFPFLFRTKELKNAYHAFVGLNGMDYNLFCQNGLSSFSIVPSDSIAGPSGKFPLMAKIFEEFEYLGWYCENYTNGYKFIEGPNHESMETRVQFWSHGGIGAFEEQIKEILNGKEG